MRIYLFTTIAFMCTLGCKQEKKDTRGTFGRDSTWEINLGHDIKLVIPTHGEKQDSCRHYTNIELKYGNDRVYQDSTQNEYIFLCNKFYPQARKLRNNRFEILLEEFDGPDIDKTLAIYLKDGKFESAKLLPFFGNAPEEDIDGKKEYHGILNTIEGYSNDSCYYDPMLYYYITEDGIMLDSLVTRQKISDRWGKFYGYERSDKIVLPCPTKK